MRLRTIVILLLIGMGTAHANQAGEREHLARLAHEIEALEALVNAAEAQAGYRSAHRLPVRLAPAGSRQGPPGDPRAPECARG